MILLVSKIEGKIMTQKICFIIDERFLIAEMVSMVVESFYDMQCKVFTDGQEAIEALKNENENVDLVICDYSLPKINGGEIFQHLKEHYPQIPFVLNSVDPLEKMDVFSKLTPDKDFYYVNRPFSHEQLIGAFISALNDQCLVQDHEYVSVGMKYFKIYHHLMDQFEVFIKLSDHKVVKISHEGDSIDLKEIEKYEDRNLKSVHFLKEDFNKFSITVFNTVFQTLDNENSTLEEKVGGQVDAVIVTHNLLRQFGVNNSVLKMAEKTVEVTINEINKTPKFAELLEHIRERNDYKAQLSTLSCYISTILGSKVSWCNLKNLRKLAYSALFQDIALYTSLDNFKPDRLYPNTEDFKKLSKEERNLIKDHPLDSIVLIEGLENELDEIKSIIVQHHERPDGTGYPRGLNAANISPLSTINILSNELAHYLITKNDINKDELLKYFEENFNFGNFRGPLQIFKQTFF